MLGFFNLCFQSGWFILLSSSVDSFQLTILHHAHGLCVSVGTIMIWIQAMECGVRAEREMKRGWVLIGGWCGSECDGVFHQQLSMSAHPPVPHP